MSDEMEEFGEIFKEETYELLGELENSLMELDTDPENKEIIGAIFRMLHTIKGSGAMFGFDTVSAFAHQIENVFDLVREDSLIVTKDLIGYTLEAKDFINEIVESAVLTPAQEEKRKSILSNLNTYCEIHSVKGGVKEPKEEKSEELSEVSDEAIPDTNEEEDIQKTFRIRFAPSELILQSGTDPAELINELRALGKTSMMTHLNLIPDLKDIIPDHCYMSWDILLTTDKSIDAIKDIFIFLDEDSKVEIELIDDATDEDDYKKLGNILVDKGDLSVEKMNEVVSKQPKFGEILVESGLAEHEKIESALLEQKHVREVRKERNEKTVASSLRVSSVKVDNLVDLVGELVTAQARLSQISDNISDVELVSLSEDMERLIWELRDNTMEMRMLPFGSTFGKFKRLVRDLSSNLNKEIELITEGGETELDKTVIEKLGDPLTHIIRNSIDHGIEEPEERVKKGKSVKGTIMLSAYHSGANVIVEISDDGAGLNLDKILEKAKDKGVLPKDGKLSEKEIASLIFKPGFSTAKEVTNVSGRGVGMDVVKKNIDLLRGVIEVDSKKGEGTIIKLKIPLTLAIIDGLLIAIGNERFILPLSTVEECIEIKYNEIAKSDGRQFVNRRGELIPYINLRAMFDLNENIPELEQVVVTNIDGERIGFVVDRVVGGHQTVIKSLGSIYKNIEGISGATILGDGSIALILDVLKIIKNVELEKMVKDRGLMKE